MDLLTLQFSTSVNIHTWLDGSWVEMINHFLHSTTRVRWMTAAHWTTTSCEVRDFRNAGRPVATLSRFLFKSYSNFVSISLSIAETTSQSPMCRAASSAANKSFEHILARSSTLYLQTWLLNHIISSWIGKNMNKHWKTMGCLKNNEKLVIRKPHGLLSLVFLSGCTKSAS